MTNDAHDQIRQLLDRLCRLAAAEEWTGDLNPSQYAALAYLARANRFSRAPSQVAEYLSSTRGTVSQTLKALHRKGFVAENRSETDRRSISYEVTAAGREALRSAALFEEPLSRYGEEEADELAGALHMLLSRVVQARGARRFGLCRNCMHHRSTREHGYCALLNVDLKVDEATEICFEHSAA